MREVSRHRLQLLLVKRRKKRRTRLGRIGRARKGLQKIKRRRKRRSIRMLILKTTILKTSQLISIRMRQTHQIIRFIMILLQKQISQSIKMSNRLIRCLPIIKRISNLKIAILTKLPKVNWETVRRPYLSEASQSEQPVIELLPGSSREQLKTLMQMQMQTSFQQLKSIVDTIIARIRDFRTLWVKKMRENV